MGWLVAPELHPDPVGYIRQKYTHENEHRRVECLDAARVANTVYAAVRVTEKDSGRSYVSAAVVLIFNTRKDGFGRKDMDEGMGPCEAACPLRILRLLSPIEDIPNPSCAADWRARVLAHHESLRAQRQATARLHVGCVVTLQAPVSFPDGFSAAVFQLYRFRKTVPIFEPVDRPGFTCRLRRATLAAAVVTSAAA